MATFEEQASIDRTLDRPEYRVEGPFKVSGQARYAADMRMPGMLTARFLMSPYPHARIVSIDTSAAKAVPGVHAVLTSQDIGAKRYGKAVFDWPVLAIDRVLYIGERIAAVAAETREAAEEAVSLIVVEYEELPAVFDAEEALKPEAPVLHPGAADYVVTQKSRDVPHPNSQGYAFRQAGEPDLERLFAEAHLVVEDVYTGPRQHQGYIEPHACLVWIDDAGVCQVISTNKAPFGLRSQLAHVSGLPPSQINVDSMFIGGDFGGKGHSIDEFACFFLAQATGRPVRSVMTYADELISSNPQHSAKYYLRSAVDADGHIVAHECRAYLNAGAYGGSRPSPHNAADGGMECLVSYRVPNVRLEAFFVNTNQVPSGNMRAPGDFHRGLAGEGHIDHIARALGLHPLELRKRNVLRGGEPTMLGHKIRNPQGEAVLKTLEEAFDWSAPLPPNHGRGIALRHRHIGAGKSNVALRLGKDGQIEVFIGAPDQGGGASTVALRVAAAALSVPEELINIRYGSTSEAPVDSGVGAARTTHVLGRATMEGAILFKHKLEELAAEVLGWPAGEVVLRDGSFVRTDDSKETTSFEVVATALGRGAPVEATGSYDSAQESHHEEGGDFNFYAYAVEVEVDTDTGQVRVVDALAVLDVGTIINPIAHQGQLDGGFIYGLGNTFTEDLVIEEGRVANPSLADYKLPCQMDVPPFRSILVPTDIGPGPFGAKAAGELTNTGVGGAVVNAITDAVGVQITGAPITSELVLEALNQRQANGHH